MRHKMVRLLGGLFLFSCVVGIVAALVVVGALLLSGSGSVLWK